MVTPDTLTIARQILDSDMTYFESMSPASSQILEMQGNVQKDLFAAP